VVYCYRGSKIRILSARPAEAHERMQRGGMLIGESGSAVSIFTSVIEYSIWGAGTLLFFWGATHLKKESKRKRLGLAFIWLIVIMWAASTVDLLYGQTMYSVQQKIILQLEFVLLFVAACILTYRLVRRAGGRGPTDPK